jgi:MFS family permease
MNKKSHSSGEESGSMDLLANKEMTPLPRLPFFVICCVVLSESFSITMIFPFIARMVRDFGVSDEDDIGFYAGWIASSFNLAQFIAAFMWGMRLDASHLNVMFIFIFHFLNLLFPIRFTVVSPSRACLGLHWAQASHPHRPRRQRPHELPLWMVHHTMVWEETEFERSWCGDFNGSL